MFFIDQTPQDLLPAQFYVEYRERFERRIDRQFNNSAGDNRSDLLTRLRFGVKVQLSKTLNGQAEYQNASDVWWMRSGNNATDLSDATLAFLRYSENGFSTTAGRQKIELGEMRLIGPTEWYNLSRAFDIARFQLGAWDLWGGKLGVAPTKPETAKLAVLTHTDRHWGTSSLIYKHDLAKSGAIDETTFNHFLTVGVGRLRIDGEGALQYGHNNGLTQQAWAYHARAAYPLAPKTSVFVEADAASGGKTSSTSHTFDNLYPSNHGLYGLADMTGWSNMNHYALGLEHRCTSDLTVRARAQVFSLRDASDAWYNYAGVPNTRVGGTFVDPAGNSGRNLGSEYDLEAAWKSRFGTFSAGASLFAPGDYVQNVSGHKDNQVYGYLQYQVRF